MKTLPAESHVSVSSMRDLPVRRFHSSNPTTGRDDRRSAVSPQGFEAIPGYKPTTRKVNTGARLRNIRELTYTSSPREQLQIGSSEVDSQQIVVPDTTVFPWRASAALRITVPGKTELFNGTGWFIGPYTLITAAHAVYPREFGAHIGWATSIDVIPGLNGDSNPPPFGVFRSTSFFCPTGWQTGGDTMVDYAAILLGQSVGSQVGTLGYATYSDQDILQSVANLTGYPVDPPSANPSSGTQWYAAGAVSHVDDTFIYYNLETLPGESGSAVYRNVGDQSFVMAIHEAEVGNSDRGLRIIEPVYENLQQWANMRP
jgi:glutamyl endopeptidase